MLGGFDQICLSAQSGFSYTHSTSTTTSTQPTISKAELQKSATQLVNILLSNVQSHETVAAEFIEHIKTIQTHVNNGTWNPDNIDDLKRKMYTPFAGDGSATEDRIAKFIEICSQLAVHNDSWIDRGIDWVRNLNEDVNFSAELKGLVNELHQFVHHKSCNVASDNTSNPHPVNQILGHGAINLPDELKCEIMRFLLSDSASFIAMKLTSKTAYALANALWANQTINFSNFSWWNQNLANTCVRFGQLQCETLVLTIGKNDFDPGEFEKLMVSISNNPSIKELHLNNAPVECLALVKSVNTTSKITHFSASRGELSEKIAEVIADMPNLVYLNIDNCYGTLDALHKLKNSTTLRTLHVDGYQFHSNGGYDLNGFTQLTVLSAKGNTMHQKITFPNLPQLRVLRFNNQHSHDLAAIANMSDLTELEISSSWPTNLTPLANATKLTTLDISNSFLNPEASIPFLAGLTNLTNLNMSNNSSEANAATWHTAETKTSELKKIQNEQLEEFQKNAPYNAPPMPSFDCFLNLVRLDVSRNSLLPKSLMTISVLTRLTVLKISRNALTSTTSLEGLTNLKNLVELKMGTNPCVRSCADFANLVHILVVLPGLTKLACHEVITTAVKTNPITQLTQLRSLNMRNNKLYPEDGKNIAHLTNLITLNISHNNLGHQGITHLTSLRKLKEVNILGNDFTPYEKSKDYDERYTKQLLRK